MNTHLHVLEAYTVLYQVWPDEFLKSQLLNLINIFKGKIINNNYQYDLFFDENWNVQSTKTSYGHDIEGSWLMCEAAYVVGDENLINEIQQLAIRTVDKTISVGFDKDGGLMNEVEPGKFLDSDKHWWPQVEAMVGLVNAWQITGDERYLGKTIEVWSFIKQNLIDHKNGEWHWMVHRNGEVNFKEEKAGPWKCPYHNGRGLIEVCKRLS
jgi:mannobiose 2-epimerase